MEDSKDKVVFTGDTLFIGGRKSLHLLVWRSNAERIPGCGRFFEGTPAEMDTALNKTLAALPNETKVYVGNPKP